jgi:hypothetical protein
MTYSHSEKVITFYGDDPGYAGNHTVLIKLIDEQANEKTY